MTQPMARIVFAVTLIAATPVTFTITFLLAERTLLPSDTDALIASSIITALLFILFWILFWRKHVVWSKSRHILTLMSVFWCLGLTSVLGLIFDTYSRRRAGVDEETVLVVAITWLPLWILSTVLIWQDSDLESVARVLGSSDQGIPCPECGYDLTGLYEARCPECGEQFTLDQLLALVRYDRAQIDER